MRFMGNHRFMIESLKKRNDKLNETSMPLSDFVMMKKVTVDLFPDRDFPFVKSVSQNGIFTVNCV